MQNPPWKLLSQRAEHTGDAELGCDAEKTQRDILAGVQLDVG